MSTVGRAGSGSQAGVAPTKPKEPTVPTAVLPSAVLPTAVPTSADVAPDVPAPVSGCAACAHPEAGHDAVSLRWCRATAAAALDRACVCRIG